ncbi:LacI family DNA-binding transcriptional regulator [Mycobacterium sp. 236(2023)]|uniref:LacI family DNA-binding transcriptional regulator n=1 Tax=Mycobacterium sp. 236(2023) TaxID=3038163 RepID=UPI0024158274|nr:LacI family DNA-binding transcriptional regulator [Mycobacterium sp. 236(2023)]MDG4668246.1 LacI family DNA-binding transcriptional regulator [Mycobacterium sp. 236(2023)]
MKRVTMVDVARHAGTSTAVVSYVLNPGSKPVSDALRTRVLEAISELDYRPDRHARALRRKSQWGQVGLLLPDVTLPFYGMLAGAIEAVARDRNQLVLIGNTRFDASVERSLARSFVDAGVDALLVAGIADGRALSAACVPSRVPLVWLHNNRGIVGPHRVCSDHVRAGALAAHHLTEVHGCEAPLFVGGFTDEHVQHGDRDTVRERYVGFTSVVGAGHRHVTTDLTLAGAYQAVGQSLAHDGVPDGIVVGTFLQSAAVLRALADAAVRVPEDVPVVTFDADARNAYAPLSLTAVQQDIGEIARRSIDLALRTSADRADPGVLSDVSLAVAASCGCS